MKLIQKMRTDGFTKSMNEFNVAQLSDIIDKADVRYYRPGMQPIMTDAEYDAIKLRLRELDPSNERLTRVGSPYSADDLRTKVVHNVPMGSLDNTDNGIVGYSGWLETIQKKLGQSPSIFASLKIDGASVCATYRDGKLTRVATRGNGEVGEDITANGMSFIDMPTQLSEPLNIDVRGEAVLYKADFIAICDREQIAEGDRSNPRNVGNGILGRDDGQDSDLMHFIAFNLEGESFETEAAKMERLKEIGFKPVPHKICATVDEFVGFYDSVASKRDQLPFEIDGLVAVVNEIGSQQPFITADMKSRLRPKYARAVKFSTKVANTVINGVILSVGHTGAIIPTGVLQEVRIGGVNVTHALLNNWDEIKRLGIAIGDTVEIGLAGDIIPKCLRLIKKGENRKPIDEPHRCPACGEVASREYRGKKGAVTYCSSKECHAAKLAKIDHWIGTSKKGVGILGIGDTILKALWDSNLVQDPSDLYRLTVDQIKDLKLDGEMRIGASRAAQIVANISSKKCLSLSVFLGSLGIDLLGRRRVKLLVDASGGQLTKLEHWLDQQLLETIKIPGFGSTVRSAIIDGINENRALIERLLNAGVKIDGENTIAESESDCSSNQADDQADGSKPLSGYSFCLTGTRAHIADIERLGGVVKSGVSKGLSALVQADPLSASNKTKKAEEYGVPIISIDYLKQIIDGTADISQMNAGFAEIE